MTVTTTDGGSAVGDMLLVALGRKPTTKDLGVETVGLEPGEPIKVDAYKRVPGHEWLYAIGDINGKALFTHMGKYQARIVRRPPARPRPRARARRRRPALPARDLHRAAGRGGRPHDRERREGRPDRRDLREPRPRATPAARSTAATRPGTTRWIVDRERRIVVGCTITGAEVADFLHAATIAIVGEVPLERLRHAIPIVSHAQRNLAATGRLKRKVDAEGAA